MPFTSPALRAIGVSTIGFTPPCAPPHQRNGHSIGNIGHINKHALPFFQAQEYSTNNGQLIVSWVTHKFCRQIKPAYRVVQPSPFCAAPSRDAPSPPAATPQPASHSPGPFAPAKQFLPKARLAPPRPFANNSCLRPFFATSCARIKAGKWRGFRQGRLPFVRRAYLFRSLNGIPLIPNPVHIFTFAPPNTCGCRRINLSVIVWAISPKSNAPRSSAICAWNTTCKEGPPTPPTSRRHRPPRWRRQFVHFLHRVQPDTLMVLFLIPRTSIRRAQTCHDRATLNRLFLFTCH